MSHSACVYVCVSPWSCKCFCENVATGVLRLSVAMLIFRMPIDMNENNIIIIWNEFHIDVSMIMVELYVTLKYNEYKDG